MRPLIRGTLIGLLALTSPVVWSIPDAGPAQNIATSQLPGGRFGPLTIYRPVGEIKSVVLFVSGDGGWHLGVVDAAQKFAAEGALVVGINVRQYLASLRPRDQNAGAGRCVSLAGDFESLSHYVQRALMLPEYLLPTLVGYSSGATIVYAALAESPRGTFRSAISLGFCPDQSLNGALPCKVNGLAYTVDTRPKAGDTLIFEPHGALRDPWIALQGARDQVCSADTTRRFAAAVSNARLLDLPLVGHGFSVTANWWPQLRAAYGELPPSIPAALMTASSVPASAIAGLPVHEVTVANAHPEYLALLITGDGGWAGLDQDLAAELVARGVPVVALSSLRYFWKAHTPEQTAADVASLLQHYLEQWHASKLLLIGYSFGADVLPFVMTRLPDALRARVASLTLLGPSPMANFEISVAEWLPGVSIRGLPTMPEVRRLGAVPVLCVHGSEEKDSLCPNLDMPNVRLLTIGKGHHFDGDIKDIAAAIVAAHEIPAADPN
jgi:type IV secretory pathway VirJ component